MKSPVPKYFEALELAVQADALLLDARANELSGMNGEHRKGEVKRFPNAERVAQLRGFANHLRAMSAVRMRARYQP